MLTKSVALVLGAAATASALVPRDVCNANNCLRALRAASPTTRLAQAKADCAAFFFAQSPPPAPVLVTVTSYTTLASTSTSVSELTATSTIEQVDTATVTETPTTSVGPSSTLTLTVTEAAGGGGGTLRRREATTLPVYASACTNVVRYSSACSCIGVTAGPPEPPVTNTLTVVLPTTSATVETRVTTVTTVDVTSTVSTSTETATADPTTLGGGVTTATITTTVAAAAPTVTGAIYVDGPGYQAPASFYTSSDIQYLQTFPSTTVPSQFELRPDGTLWYGPYVAKGNPQNSGAAPLQFFFVRPEVAVATRQPFICKVVDGYLSCAVGPATQTPLYFSVNPSNGFIYCGSAANEGSRTRINLRLT